MSNNFCPSCRRTLSENAKFCTECGSRIDLQITRRELENSITEETGGLQIDKTGEASNPFYTKCNNLKDKIINPALSPLSEKKRFVFKNWEDIRREEESMEPVPELPEEAAVSEMPKVWIEEEQSEDVEDFEVGSIEGESDTLAETTTEEVVGEATVEADITAEEVFEEDIEIETEEIVEEVEEELAEPISELPKEASASEIPKVWIEEEQSEDVEDFETEPIAEEEFHTSTETTAEEPVEPISEFLEETFASEIPKILIEEEQSEDIEGLEVEPVVEEETDTSTDTIAEEPSLEERIISEALKSVGSEGENRIITSSVGGGFKRRAPQAEEVKNVTALFGKKGRNNKHIKGDKSHGHFGGN